VNSELLKNQDLADQHYQSGNYPQMLQSLQEAAAEKAYVVFLNDKLIELADKKPQDIDIFCTNVLPTISQSPYAYAFFYNVALIYKKSGKLRAAKTYLIRSIENKPDFDKAVISLRKILLEMQNNF
jgi:hypothetical protein